jgi:hypothetical protein
MLSRRDFLRNSSLTIAGAIACSNSGDLLANPLTIMQLFRAFVSNVGANIVASEVVEFIKTPRGSKHSETVKQANLHMAKNGGFDDTSISAVYERGGSIFYPVGRKDGSVNICAPIIESSKSKVIQMVEGPTVMALGLASTDMALKSTKAKIALALLPIEKISQATGSFQDGYKANDEFKTHSGRLVVGYENRSIRRPGKSGEGTLKVLAYDRSDNPFFKEEYPIEYNDVA